MATRALISASDPDLQLGLRVSHRLGTGTVAMRAAVATIQATGASLTPAAAAPALQRRASASSHDRSYYITDDTLKQKKQVVQSSLTKKRK